MGMGTSRLRLFTEGSDSRKQATCWGPLWGKYSKASGSQELKGVFVSSERLLTTFLARLVESLLLAELGKYSKKITTRLDRDKENVGIFMGTFMSRLSIWLFISASYVRDQAKKNQ